MPYVKFIGEDAKKVVEATAEEVAELLAPARRAKLPVDGATVDPTVRDALWSRPNCTPPAGTKPVLIRMV
jgi:hypothetical protein